MKLNTLFNASFSTFSTLILFSRHPSSASCVVTATGCFGSVVFFEILLGTCCSVDACWLDHDELGCSALFSSALSPLITTSSPTSSLLLVRVTSCVGPVLTSFITSPVPVFGVSACGDAGYREPDAEDPPTETEGFGVQRNFLLRLRLGMTDDTGRLQYASHS